MFLKSKFLGVALATCVAVNIYANTCEQREKLGRASAELGFIIGMMDSDLFNGAFLLSLYSPYDKMRMNEQAFLKKQKRNKKQLLPKRAWSGTKQTFATKKEGFPKPMMKSLRIAKQGKRKRFWIKL